MPLGRRVKAEPATASASSLDPSASGLRAPCESEAPATPPPQHDSKHRVQRLLDAHSPPKLSRTARRSMKAGLICPRPESGPSVPVKAELSMQTVKQEPILGDITSSRKRARPQKSVDPSAREKRKAKSEREARFKAARLFLAGAGLAYNDYLREHTTKMPLKGAAECSTGGWNALLAQLLNGALPETCAKCMSALTSVQFSMEKFQAQLTQEIEPEPLQEAKLEATQQAETSCVKQEAEALDDNQALGCVADTDAAVDVPTAEDAEDAVDPRQLVNNNPVLVLLPPGTHSKRYPVQCLACKRKSTNKCAIFDLITINHARYLTQHITGATHVKNAKKFMQDSRPASAAAPLQDLQALPSSDVSAQPDEAEIRCQVVAVKQLPCEGFQLNHAPKSAKLGSLKEEANLWSVYTPLPSVQDLNEGNHQYTRNLNDNGLVIRHHSCAGSATVVEEDGNGAPPLCGRCSELGSLRSIVRMVCKFYIKHAAARLLAAHFFDPDQVPEIAEEIKKSGVYQLRTSELDQLLTLERVPLQNFVRTQFLSLPSSKWSPMLRDFIASVVQPCCKVPASTWDGRVANANSSVRVLAEKMKHGSLATVADLDLKLACHVASGALHNHPVVQGILVAAIEQAQRAKRGVSGFRGHQLSSLELSFMAEAGVSLAMAASNMDLVHQFGLAFTVPRLPLDNLHARNLPEPFIAQSNVEVLEQNLLLISNHLTSQRNSASAHPGPLRRFVMVTRRIS